MTVETRKVDVLDFLMCTTHVLKSVGTFVDLDGMHINGKSVSGEIAKLLAECHDVFAAIDSVVRTGNCTTDAFRKLGQGGPDIFHRPTQITECERAMVEVDKSLARIRSAP